MQLLSLSVEENGVGCSFKRYINWSNFLDIGEIWELAIKTEIEVTIAKYLWFTEERKWQAYTS